ncbi:MAG TPA: hypothetical protein VL280_12165, partial [Burkholderiales bacterium]|nr:hypothetical protein [Burkholderiales bacterium]
DNQAEHMEADAHVFESFDRWVAEFAAFVGGKGKVEPGRYRAYGHERHGHRWADMKLKWREIRIGLGVPPDGSSPARQQRLGVNRDATLRPKESEGEKLRR